MNKMEKLLVFLLLIRLSASNELRVVCTQENGCESNSLPSFEVSNAGRILHSRSATHHVDDSPSEKELVAESEKLQDEIDVVEEVETAIENKLDKMDKYRSSKTIKAELENELSVLEDLESDLVDKEKAVEEELEEKESSETDSYDDYDEGDSDYTDESETGEWSEEQSDESKDSESYDYSNSDYSDSDYSESDSKYEDEDDYRPRRNVHHSNHHKKPTQHHRVELSEHKHHHTDKSIESEESLEMKNLQDEVAVVQDIESNMENELEKLNHLRPTKIINAKEKELEKELDVMKELESDLIKEEEEAEEEKEITKEDIDEKFEEDEQSDYDEDVYDEEEYDEYDESVDEYEYTKHSQKMAPREHVHKHRQKRAHADGKKMPCKELEGEKAHRKKNPPGPVEHLQKLTREHRVDLNERKKLHSDKPKHLQANKKDKHTQVSHQATEKHSHAKKPLRKPNTRARKIMEIRRKLREKFLKNTRNSAQKLKKPLPAIKHPEHKHQCPPPQPIKEKARRSVEEEHAMGVSSPGPSQVKASQNLRSLQNIYYDTYKDEFRSELSAEERKLYDEIDVVENMENDLKHELKDLHKKRPSKLIHAEEKELKHKLTAMENLETDLIAEENTVEQERSESDSDFDLAYEEDKNNDDYDDFNSDSNKGYYPLEHRQKRFLKINYVQICQRYMKKKKPQQHFLKLCTKVLKNHEAKKKSAKVTKNHKQKVAPASKHKTHNQKATPASKHKTHNQKVTPASKHETHKQKVVSARKHNNENQIVIPRVHPVQFNPIAGKIDTERCKRCEQRVGEEVCGANGKVYNSLCHAVNCAGLSDNDIIAGTCPESDICGKNDCTKNQLCVPMTNGVCLTLYHKKGSKKPPCRQYMCVAKERECLSHEHSQVCGVNKRTYPSLCFLHRAMIQMAYTGACRPKLCKGSVCGQDGKTYESSCHARARNVRIDYNGECFAEKLDVDLTSCSDVRKAGRCIDTPCRKAVVPEGSCCPVCGGAAVIQTDYGALSSLAKSWEEVNHLYVFENFLRNLLSAESLKKCELTTSLTDTGNISIVLAAVNAEQHQVCQDGLAELVKTINKHPASLKNSVVGPVAKTAAIVNPFNPGASFSNFVTDFQNKAVSTGKDSLSKAQHKYKSTLKDVDEKAEAAENQRELEQSESKSETLKLGMFTMVLLILVAFLC